MERDTLQQKKRDCVVRPSRAEPDWWQPTGEANFAGKSTQIKKVNRRSLKDVQQNSSIPIFSTLLKKRQLYHEKKRKTLKKVCEMSKYLTLIPLLREMCFPYYHSCLEKKKWRWFWETEISMYFLLVIEQMWFGFWSWNRSFSFSEGEKFLSF